MMYMYMYDHWTELSFIQNPVGYRARKEYNLHLSEKACLIFYLAYPLPSVNKQ